MTIILLDFRLFKIMLHNDRKNSWTPGLISGLAFIMLYALKNNPKLFLLSLLFGKIFSTNNQWKQTHQLRQNQLARLRGTGGDAQRESIIGNIVELSERLEGMDGEEEPELRFRLELAEELLQDTSTSDMGLDILNSIEGETLPAELEKKRVELQKIAREITSFNYWNLLWLSPLAYLCSIKLLRRIRPHGSKRNTLTKKLRKKKRSRTKKSKKSQENSPDTTKKASKNKTPRPRISNNPATLFQEQDPTQKIFIKAQGLLKKLLTVTRQCKIDMTATKTSYNFTIKLPQKSSGTVAETFRYQKENFLKSKIPKSFLNLKEIRTNNPKELWQFTLPKTNFSSKPVPRITPNLSENDVLRQTNALYLKEICKKISGRIETISLKTNDEKYGRLQQLIDKKTTAIIKHLIIPGLKITTLTAETLDKKISDDIIQASIEAVGVHLFENSLAKTLSRATITVNYDNTKAKLLIRKLHKEYTSINWGQDLPDNTLKNLAPLLNFFYNSLEKSTLKELKSVLLTGKIVYNFDNLDPTRLTKLAKKTLREAKKHGLLPAAQAELNTSNLRSAFK